MARLSGDPEIPLATIVRDAAAVIISVDAGIEHVLGWGPAALIGRPSTEFIHPEDQPSAIAAWFEMVQAPHGETRSWQGRYRTPDGAWKWVECTNLNKLSDPEPIVVTSMRPITVDQVSLAEELRARKQLLSQLSDAMPIGMFQFDSGRALESVNDQLLTILQVPAAATVEAQFAAVVPEDKYLLSGAFDAVLAHHDVNDVELRLSLRTARSDQDRVCVLSLRPLTDGDGTVTGAVGCVADVTEQVHLRRELEYQATTDILTSCLNRAAILRVLDAALERVSETNAGLAVIYVDLCGFKQINDDYGHSLGDRVLECVAERIRSAIRKDDWLGRIGGDEFLIVCPVVSVPDTQDIAERVRRVVSEHLEPSATSLSLRASVGVAWTRRRVDVDRLVAESDNAMYESKRTGSHSVEFTLMSV
jgi:diguanylate cyclase (GGDEF)-like protein/PAS domain S-box-containing protein